MKSIFTVLNCLGLAVFLYFAYLQINDANPEIYHQASQFDAYLWIAFYLLVSVVLLMALLNRVYWPLLCITTLFGLVEIAMTAPGFIENLSKPNDFTITGSQMSPDNSKVELSREFLGTAMAIVALGLVFLQWKLGHVRGFTKRGDAS